MNKFNDDMYYYIYKDLVYPTSDEVMYEVKMRGGSIEDAMYSIKEVKGDVLNTIPKSAYEDEYWGDLIDKYCREDDE